MYVERRMMEQDKEYFAFISYKSEDVEWATWLQHELEHYHLPSSFNGRTDVPQELRPVFRDIDELSAGNLPEQIKQALDNSRNLIVICSPQSAKSPWVNQEVETFISLGRIDRIFPFIVEGNSPSEFFPPALRDLPKDEERLGGDVSKKGRDAAFVKVVAGMLGVGFDSLWNRYEKEKAEEERKQREQRDNLLRVQSRFIAEKASALVEKGDSYTARLLALEVLPQNLYHPNRPYTIEGETALRQAVQFENSILEGHINIVKSANFSPDGKRIVSASYDHTIRIWDAFTGQCLVTLEEQIEPVNSAVFSPDGKYILSASNDNTICVWNSYSGHCLVTMEGHAGYVYSATFSPDGKYVVSASHDDTIRIWDAFSGQCLQTLKGHTGWVAYASFSPDGLFVVSAASDNTIRIWEVSSGDCRHIMKGHSCTVYSAVFSPNGKYIVSASKDHNIRIWNAFDGHCIRILEGHSEEVLSASFSSDGKRIVSGSRDKTVRIWDAESGECIQNLQSFTDWINSVSFSPDNMRIVVASEVLRICDVSTMQYLKTIKGYFMTTFSSDGKFIVSPSDQNRICLWDITTGQCLKKIRGHTNLVTSTVFSPNGKHIVSASWDKTIRIWDVSTGKCIHTLQGHTDSVTSAVISPDGKFIASTSYDESVRIWEFSTGKCINIIRWGSGFGYDNTVSFSPDSKCFVSAFGMNISVWNITTGKCIRKWHPCSVISAFFSPDGKYIVISSYGKDVLICDAITGQNIHSLHGHSEYVKYASFSSDGKLIVSGSRDKTVRIWDTSTGLCLQTLQTDSVNIESVLFSPDNKYIVIVADGIIRIWYYPPLQELIDVTRERFKNRQLTSKERKKYYLE